MSEFFKFVVILLSCTVTLLIFVKFVENNIGNVKNINNNNLGYSNISSRNYLNVWKNSDSKKLLNLNDFEYRIRPPLLCAKTFIIWIVTSYAGDPAPRSAMRRAYSSEELQKYGIIRIFLLGLLDESSEKKSRIIQGAIIDEANRFNDILQGSFYEAYRNLTYKHLMGLKFAAENCDSFRYIIKQDDDIIVNLYDIIEKIEFFQNTSKEKTFAGYVLRNMKPIREPANKWFVTKNEFSGSRYPDFVSGWLYIISRENVVSLVEKSYSFENYFWIDDVFITGILRNELNINLLDIRSIYTTDFRYLECCIKRMKRQFKCEFSVGPNGGKIDLQLQFQKFSNYCRDRCAKPPADFSVTKTCVAEYEELKFEKKGEARIKSIKIG